MHTDTARAQRRRSNDPPPCPTGQIDSQLFELAIEVSSFEARALSDPGHAALLAHQMMLKVHPLKHVARFT